MTSQIYKSVNLVANREGFDAKFIDPQLINAYGLTVYDKSLWVTANVTGKLIKYSFKGCKESPVITLPSNPTGIIVNDTVGFPIGEDICNIQPSTLLFSTQDQVIGGYNENVNPRRGIEKYHSGDGAVYNGITLLGDLLYAADFQNNKIDVLDSNFCKISGDGSFPFEYPCDQPRGYIVFNVVAINGLLFVPYAKGLSVSPFYQTGAGLGFIAVYDSNGVYIKTIIGVGDHLNAPYSLTIAPENFGKFSGKLLVGNFGAGKINAWDIGNVCSSAKYLGKIKVKNDCEVVDFYINHLSTIFSYKQTVFYCAGPNQKADGVVGKITL
ncbi:MAG: TIGR03118 family protein [Harvfovirus sp.]|uniref:TIGR03118 family protein n=1 Tax=Harvfovirus sp. TaxID=2487768 RepID=A0A3G5A3U0_9VIRU|nr:MAG: TIGR03118 family protein [Harvfovirus sp.]